MDKIDRLIRESLDALILEKKHKAHKKFKADRDEDYDDDNREHIYKKKKVSHGMSKEYDYKEWKRKNRPVPKADAISIASTIDMDRTNISDVAQEIYPHHTTEGAQSQLLKVLKLERKMPIWVYNKLSDMISSGKIATK